MSKRPFIYGLLLGILLGWVTLLVIQSISTTVLDSIKGIDRQKIHSFTAIRLGMTAAEVTELMGTEGERSDTFRLGQQGGYEIEYAVAEKIGAAYFLSWKTGVALVFTVAFDTQDRVIYKASGST